jgi:TetR/AcrR family transcriptional regulator, transcriptional repressor for nem operon
MPRVSKAQTDKNRASIELVAARLFLEHGIDGVSVAELMGAAGLTHGGFYGHFDSKEALAAIACGKAFEQSAQRRQEKIDHTDSPEAALSEITKAYLRSEHRDNPGNGCPVLALATDMSRTAADNPVRAVYLEGVRKMLATLACLSPAANSRNKRTTQKPTQTENHLPEPQDNAVEQAAMIRMAILVGALTLARATAGDPLSEAFLAAGRAGILQSAARSTE